MVGWIGHVPNRVEELDSVRVVRHDEGPLRMTVADDLEVEIMFGLVITVAWIERLGEIQLL